MQFRGLLQFAFGLPMLLALGTPLLASTATPAFAATPAGDPEPRKVTLQTEDNLTLTATYYGPRDLKQKAPCAVLVHNSGGSRAELDPIALRLQKSGFAALTIDLRGHGESATEALTWKKLDADAQLQTWANTTRDVKAGVAYLLQQPGVLSTSVTLVGHGAGCALVARHARRDEKVRCVVMLSPLTEQLGASLNKDMADLGGLPLFIGAGQDEAAVAKRVAVAAIKAAGTESSVELNVAKVDAAELLTDNKFTGDLTRWMKLKAQPDGAAKAPEAKPIH